MQAAGCDRILIVPLYPQYAAATSATVCDKAFEALATMRWQPAVRIAPAYFDNPVYIDALATSLEQSSGQADVQAGRHHRLVSRHAGRLSAQGRSLLLANVTPPRGCCASVLKLDEKQLMLTFQSRFGPAEWLKPYTDATVKALARTRREKYRRHHARLLLRLP